MAPLSTRTLSSSFPHLLYFKCMSCCVMWFGLTKAGLAHICKLKNYSDFVFIYSEVRAIRHWNIWVKQKTQQKYWMKISILHWLLLKTFSKPCVTVLLEVVEFELLLDRRTTYCEDTFPYVCKYELLGKKNNSNISQSNVIQKSQISNAKFWEYCIQFLSLVIFFFVCW